MPAKKGKNPGGKGLPGKPRKEKIRLNLDLIEEDHAILEENVDLDGAASYVEVVRKALRLQNAVLKNLDKEGEFIFRTKDKGEIKVLII